MSIEKRREKISYNKCWFFEKRKKDKPQPDRLGKKERKHKLPVSVMKWDITTDPEDIKRIIRITFLQTLI